MVGNGWRTLAVAGAVGGDGRVGGVGSTQEYLNGGERRLVEALEVAAHLPLAKQLPAALPQRQRPAPGIPLRRRSVEDERGHQGQRNQARPRRRRHRLHWHSPAEQPKRRLAGKKRMGRARGKEERRGDGEGEGEGKRT